MTRENEIIKRLKQIRMEKLITTIVIAIIVIAFTLYLGGLKIILNPFSIKLPNYLLIIGIWLLIIGYSIILTTLIIRGMI